MSDASRSGVPGGGIARAQPHDRDLEDAAVVVTVLAALGANVVPAPTAHGPDRSFWGDPRHRITVTPILGPHGWWASGLPR